MTKYTKLFKSSETFLGNINVFSVRDNVWNLWIFMREFPLTAVEKHFKVDLSHNLVYA